MSSQPRRRIGLTLLIAAAVVAMGALLLLTLEEPGPGKVNSLLPVEASEQQPDLLASDEGRQTATSRAPQERAVLDELDQRIPAVFIRSQAGLSLEGVLTGSGEMKLSNSAGPTCASTACSWMRRTSSRPIGTEDAKWDAASSCMMEHQLCWSPCVVEFVACSSSMERRVFPFPKRVLASAPTTAMRTPRPTCVAGTPPRGSPHRSRCPGCRNPGSPAEESAPPTRGRRLTAPKWSPRSFVGLGTGVAQIGVRPCNPRA